MTRYIDDESDKLDERTIAEWNKLLASEDSGLTAVERHIVNAIVLLASSDPSRLALASNGYWSVLERAWKVLRKADWIRCQREGVQFTDDFDPDSIYLRGSGDGST